MEKGQYVVYISCVGEQDPTSSRPGVEGVEGSLLTCFRYLTEEKGVNFNSAYLIPTSKSLSPQRHTEDSAEKCRQRILETGKCSDVQIKPLEVKNPADLKQVYPKMRELLGAIIKEVQSKAKGSSVTFHINVSSGTPQMKESLPFLVSIDYFAPHKTFLWQVFDPRGGETQVVMMAIQERVQPAPEVDLLTRERILLRIEQLTRQHLYQAASLLFRDLPSEYSVFEQVFLVLARHDQWLYRDAYNRLSGLLRNPQGLPDYLQNWLQKFQKWLQSLSRRHKVTLAIDRYYCARRRYESQLYPDAVAHFWTACELALESYARQHRLFQPPPIVQGTATPQELPTARELIEMLKVPLRLEEINCGAPSPDHYLYGALHWLRTIRNRIEHGTQPSENALAEHACKITECLFNTLKWQRELNDCPVKPEIVQEHLHRLIQDIRDSLWR